MYVSLQAVPVFCVMYLEDGIVGVSVHADFAFPKGRISCFADMQQIVACLSGQDGL